MLTLARKSCVAFATTLIMVALPLFTLLGCKEECGDSIERSVALVAAKSDLTLAMESAKKIDPLEFLLDSTIVWDNIDLNLTLKGRIPALAEISISANGLKLTSKNGRSVHEALAFNTKKDTSTLVLRLNKLSVNGAEPFGAFLNRLKKNKGTLILHLETMDRSAKNKWVPVTFLDGVMKFKGLSKIKCTPPPTTTPTPTPAPTPTPVPEKPVTTITSMDPAATLTASTTMAVAFTSSIPESTFWCSLDSGTAELCNSPKIFSNLSNGGHTINVYAQSPQGVIENPGASRAWTVDAVAPTVTITNAALLALITSSDSIEFQLSASKAGSTFKCSLDGSVAAVCSSSRTYSALAEGTHSFAVSAVDSLGNVSKTPTVFKWTVDRTAPEARFVDITPTQPITNSTGKNITFLATESARFECALDGANFEMCESPKALSELSEGDHRFDIRAIDAAGNQGLAVSYAWTVDLTAPTVILGATTPAPGLSNAKEISVNFSGSEAATFYCSVDGQPSKVCESPLKLASLTEGSHGVEISVVDAAGNIGSSQVLQWELDFSAPVISLGTVLPSASVILNSSEVSVGVNLPAGASLTAAVDSSPMTPSTNPLVLSLLSEGDHTISFQAVDAAGNLSEILTHNFRIDMTAPTVTLTPEIAATLVNLDRNSFALSATESATFECALDDSGFASCSTPAVFAGLADGDHKFQVRATDAAANVSSVSQHIWKIDTIAPTTSISTTVVDHSASFTLSANEAGANFECALDGGTFVACGNSVTINDLALGTHSFVAKAIDSAGNADNVGATSSFNIIDPIHTTLTSRVPSDSVTNLTSMTFTFTADQAPASFRCSIDGAAPVLCTSPYNYSGISDGPHTFNVKAMDALGNLDAVGATHAWTVDTLGPAISNITTASTSNTITVTWTTNEPATTQLRYGSGFTVNQSTSEVMELTLTHTVKLPGLLANSNYTVQIANRDGLGNASVSSTRTVKTAK